MHKPIEWQDEFAAALMNPHLPAPRRVIDPMGEPSQKRFGVYRNNVVLGLVEALREVFPVACRIVGSEFFDAVARLYALRNPPQSPILLDYGVGFAEFVEAFEPADGVPYLGDVCRIEKAWLEAYHASEAEPASWEVLNRVSTGGTSRVHLALHPSLRVVRSRFPALTIWSSNIEGGIPIPVAFDAGGEDVLIARPQASVEVRGLSRGEMEFIQALLQSATISSAAERAQASEPTFSLSAALEGLVAAGLVVDVHANSTSESTRGGYD